MDQNLVPAQPSIPDNIACPLCLGAGELTRAEVLDRLGVKDFARVAQLSAEEAFRLLHSQYKQDGEALWTRFECELARRLGEAERQHATKVQELEAQIKVSKERSALESQRIRAELEARLRSEQSDKDDFRRRIEEYLSELSRLRARNQELEAEMSKVARVGRKEELDFADDARTWAGIAVSEKLAKNGDFILAYRDASGTPQEPRVLVDCKDKLAIAENDIKKLIRDARERRIPVAVIVARNEEQLRQVDRDCRWAQECGIWVLRTTRSWIPRDLEVLRPIFERMRSEGPDFLQKNAHIAGELRRTFTDLDEIDKELKKAAKAIDAASAMTGKYKTRLLGLCEIATAQKMTPTPQQGTMGVPNAAAV